MVNIMFPKVIKITAKGKDYYYYRHKGKRIKIGTDPTSADFAERYHEIHSSFEDTGRPPQTDGSVAKVVVEFMGSADFRKLSASTRANYITHLNTIMAMYGNLPIHGISRRVVKLFQQKMLTKPGVKDRVFPARANYAIEVLRRLLSYAYDLGYIEANPASKPKRFETGSYRPWTHDEILSCRKAADDNMKLAIDLGLYTGQRAGDIILMRWNQIDERLNGISLKQGKTGEELWVPVHSHLRPSLAAAREKQKSDKLAALTVLTTKSGKPYNINHFKREIGRLIRKAGLTGIVFHGLRHNASNNLVEAGCTEKEAQAITGHRTTQMFQRYSRKADQKKLASSAMEKLESVKPFLHKV